MSLPLINQHLNHIVNRKTQFYRKTHPLILQKIKDLIIHGVREIKDLQEHLYNYAESSLVECVPEGVSSKYLFPTTRAITNHRNKFLVKLGFPLEKKYGKKKKIVMMDPNEDFKDSMPT